jgi:hypothetical protein
VGYVLVSSAAFLACSDDETQSEGPADATREPAPPPTVAAEVSREFTKVELMLLPVPVWDATEQDLSFEECGEVFESAEYERCYEIADASVNGEPYVFASAVRQAANPQQAASAVRPGLALKEALGSVTGTDGLADEPDLTQFDPGDIGDTAGGAMTTGFAARGGIATIAVVSFSRGRIRGNVAVLALTPAVASDRASAIASMLDARIIGVAEGSIVALDPPSDVPAEAIMRVDSLECGGGFPLASASLGATNVGNKSIADLRSDITFRDREGRRLTYFPSQGSTSVHTPDVLPGQSVNLEFSFSNPENITTCYAEFFDCEAACEPIRSVEPDA